MIFVTGATGLLGSHLVHKLISLDKPIRLLIRRKESMQILADFMSKVYPKTSIKKSNIEFFLGDINDKYAMKEACQGVDYVYHCAADVSFQQSGVKQMLDVNIRGTENLVDACLIEGTKKFAHVSSIAAVNTPVEETYAQETSGWPTGKSLDYSYSKTKSEFEVWRGIEEGLNAVIVNPSVILGEGALDSGSGKLFGLVYKGLRYYTNGVTGYIDVRDTVEALTQVMLSDISGERYILNAENITYKDFFTKVAEALSVKPPHRYAGKGLSELAWRLEKMKSALLFKQPALTKKAARIAHAEKYYTSKKFTEVFNFSYTSIDETIKRLADYYLKELS